MATPGLSNPPRDLAHRIGHSLIFLPAAVALHDLTRQLSIAKPWRRRALTAGLAVLCMLAVKAVVKLAHEIERGKPRRGLPSLTYPPSLLLSSGFFYLPLRLGWMAARRLGAKPLSPGVTALAAISPVALSLYGAFVGPFRLRQPTLRVKFARLPAGFEGLRIAHLSDLHAGPFLSEKRLERLALQVAETTPDLVVLTGDIVNSRPEEAPAVGRALAKIRAPLGIVAVLGNHDRFIDGDQVVAHLRAAGIEVLLNQGRTLTVRGESIWLCGVDDCWTKRADLARALEGRPPGMPTLLLAHDPALFPEASRSWISLTLSGHTHGGQIALPGLRQSGLARTFTRFVAGLYQLGSARLLVSRGCGVVVPPIRVGVPPEAATVVLTRG